MNSKNVYEVLLYENIGVFVRRNNKACRKHLFALIVFSVKLLNEVAEGYKLAVELS